MSRILAVFSVLKELITLVKVLMDMVEANRVKAREVAREVARQELDKAIEELKAAKTDEEIADAQKRIVRASLGK